MIFFCSCIGSPFVYTQALKNSSQSAMSVILTRLDNRINTPSDEFAPWLVGSQFFYTGSISDDSTAAHCYTIEINRSASAAKRLEKDNGLRAEGTYSFTADGETVVFASDNPNGYGSSDIYIGTWKRGRVISAENLGSKVNGEFWDAQPCISANGNSIYFVTNRNKQTKTDIYVTFKMKDGSWSQAQPLSSRINTAFNERTPYVSLDERQIFFARDINNNYDIFSSRKIETEWSESSALGYGINTPYDELSFCASYDTDSFFIASNRPNGSGGFDIYVGTPNFLTSGTSTLVVKAIDAITGGDLPVSCTLIDQQSRQQFISLNEVISPLRLTVYAKRSYVVNVRAGGYQSFAETAPINEGQSDTVLIPLNVLRFSFDDKAIPFFIAGYYRPNIVGHIETIMETRVKQLKGAQYIEQFEKNSKRYNEYIATEPIVDSIFNSIVKNLRDTVFERFDKYAPKNDTLEIHIIGFADPKPITGNYIEQQTLSFYSLERKERVTVKNGEAMNNEILSGLRAIYAKELIEERLRQTMKERFSLISNGRIRLIPVAGGTNINGITSDSQRRIKIEFYRTITE